MCRLKKIFLAIMSFTFLSLTAQAKPKIVLIDGSSTVFPVTEAVAEEFQKAQRGKIRVTVGISGTGGGFKKFCRGETDVQNASRPISAEEILACKQNNIKYFELPIAYDAITVAVHPSNTWVDYMSVDELKKIWAPSAERKITRWNQIRPNWPDEPIKLFGAGADSGTFDYFTEAIVGKSKASRGDFTASEDDNTLVQGISSDTLALGFLPYSYFESNQNRLKAVPILGGEKAPSKNPVSPSRETVIDTTYYPLSRPIFIYVSASAYERSEVKAFSEFYLKNAQNLANQVQYVGLSERAYSIGLKNMELKKTGTAFGGHNEVGVNVEHILDREKI